METAALGTLALRVGRFAESIQEAHRFGTEPGDTSEPWCLSFHRKAFEVYRGHLSDSYLRRLAAVFADGSRALAGHSHVPEQRVEHYLRNSATAICERLSPSTPHTASIGDGLEEILLRDRTPSVMLFTALARIVSREGASALANAGFTTHERLCLHLPSTLSGTEVRWLRRLADGDTTAALAVSEGYSERSLYRRLRAVWRRLGATTRQEGIAIAIREGWI